MIPSFSSIGRRAALLAWLAGSLATVGSGLAQAHGGSAGDVQIDHPYAMPTPAGAQNGAAYILALKNGGNAPDRLLKAATPVAQRTEIHTMSLDANGVMRMREVGEIALPPGQRVEMKPGMGYHLMLIGLKQPLKVGDNIPLTLEFERGGKAEVEIVVQKAFPGADGNAHGAHSH